MTIGFLDGCEAPRCRKVAVKLVQAVSPSGIVAEEMNTCAYCAKDIDVPDEYELQVVDK